MKTRKFTARILLATAQLAAVIAMTGVGVLPATAFTPDTGGAGLAPKQPPAVPAGKPVETLPWLGTLNDAYTEAQRRRQPILVLVGAKWCGPCQALHEQIATGPVQEKLAIWVRVSLDADNSPDVPRALAVSAIPALRVLSPSGKVIASHDGYLEAAALIEWLKKAYDKALPTHGDEVLSEITEATVPKLVARLGESDATVREACLRRLGSRPDLAAVPVAAAMEKGNLAVRLSAMELLRGWKAPIEQLDPWQPATIDADKLKALTAWSNGVKAAGIKTTNNAKVTEAQLADAGADITTMIQASTDAQAAAVRERLASLGAALLPEVAARVKTAPNDQARERLTALRYRLPSTDALALTWPGGFERLASTDASTRRAAVNELAARATTADVPLLLELFSDSDAVLRETSLRALKTVGGDGATSGLARLLHDPEPNVRAAVLKQLAETPSPQLTGALTDYIKTEKDADLLVHGVRALRSAKGNPAIASLQGLLSHENWRVRAEAVEGLSELVSELNDERKVDAYVAIVKLLDDPDGYVVGRAVAALKSANLPASFEPLARIAEKYPDMAVDVVETIANSGRNGTPSGVPQLRKLFKSANERVRAAAIGALAGSIHGDASEDVQTAMKDASSIVRIAGAHGIYAIMDMLRPQQRSDGEHRDMSKWLEEFRSGKSRPAWLSQTLVDLRAMLKSDNHSEQLAASVPLAAMGEESATMSVLLKAAAGTTADQLDATKALKWVPWNERLQLFNVLAAQGNEKVEYWLMHNIVDVPDPRAAAPLWATLAKPDVHLDWANSVFQALNTLYFADDDYSFNRSELPAMPAETKDFLTKMAQEGSDMQRSLALALLLVATPNEVGALAKKVITDPSSTEWNRIDAFQVLLLALDKTEAQKTAVDVIAKPDAILQKVALPFLAIGNESVQTLRGTIRLRISNHNGEFNSDARPAAAVAPPGITPELLKPFLEGNDPPAAAAAGYLAVLLGDKSGIKPLLAEWQLDRSSRTWTPALYRAVAALNDDGLTYVLEDIYNTHMKESRYETRDFYWTIRSMTGPNILKLRKKIRDEVGMDQLR